MHEVLVVPSHALTIVQLAEQRKQSGRLKYSKSFVFHRIVRHL
ncbi:hypothetical protein PALB_22610 [Pseudoalteromonas luteoviolacea B = ATCC 29581]|nr:hypothetical protein PALB_22610 [Pseudoalteromonas luteoviolacea B = ATCC 29581]